MGYEYFIAKKHLSNRRKSGFISIISIISIAGVAVGVMALIVVLAVMSGFDTELKNKIVSVQPHVRVERMGGIENRFDDIAKIKDLRIPGIQSVAAFIEGQAIIRSSEDATGVLIKGIDTDNDDLAIYQKHLIHGQLDFGDSVVSETKKRFFFFKKTVETRTGSLMIGEELANRLRVRVGDSVTLISPFQDPDKPLSFSKAETRSFVIKGVFRVGMNDFDASLALISLPQAQEMYHLGTRVTGISLRFFDVDDAERWKLHLRGNFTSDYFIRSWYDMNHSFFQALKVEKSVMTILLALIILVAVFNIVATLTMVVMEKTRDIGILRAIGATRASIRKIFLIEGFSIGFYGIIAGTITGLLMAFNLNPISEFIKQTTGLEVFPSDIYYFDRIPAEVHPQDVLITVAFALLASMMAGVYPAHRAAAVNPIEALRDE